MKLSFVLLVLSLLLVGCASKTAPVSYQQQSKVDSAVSEFGQDAVAVYIYRTKNTLFSYPVEICYGSSPIGTLSYDDYAVFVLNAGYHELKYGMVADEPYCSGSGSYVGTITVTADPNDRGIYVLRLKPNLGTYDVVSGSVEQTLSGRRLVATFVDPSLKQKLQSSPETAPETTPNQSGQASIDDAIRKCEELGFTKGTEKFGSCVLKLSQ
jgi:hypothetical protein